MKTLDYPDIPFHALLQQAAERWADRTALVFKDQRISYEELNRRTDRVAAGLHAMGVRRGDRVALFTPNCPEYEIAFFACARIGAVPTPLNPSYKEREVLRQLQDSEAVAALVDVSLMPFVESVRSEAPQLTCLVSFHGCAPGAVEFDALCEGKPAPPPTIALSPADLAALPYSSGTTAGSKGVMLTQRNLVCNASQYVDATQTTTDDVLLIFLPLYHIYGVILMATAVTSGATQVLMTRFDLGEVVRLVEAEQCTQLYVVPPVMLALAGTPGLAPETFRSLRFIQSAAAPLAPDVARRVADRLQVRVIQAYGSTESSPLSHMVPLQQPNDTYGSVGVPVADTRCRIVDGETGDRELAPGEVGEVTVAGPQVMAGYWNAPRQTAEVLRAGWLHTGDIGSVDAEGNLSIVDRMKEMIKYKAFSIAPAELEGVLLEHPDVADCGVIGLTDPEAGEVPHAYVVLRPASTSTPDTLLNFVRDRVAGYKQIRGIHLVDSIPRTPSGKILRRVLKERARSE